MKPEITQEIKEVAPSILNFSQTENHDKAMPANYFENFEARMMIQAKTLHSLQPKSSIKDIQPTFFEKLIDRIFAPIPNFAIASVVGVIAIVSFYSGYPPTSNVNSSISLAESNVNSDFDIEEFLDEEVEEDLI
jgi:hypothetical protein